MADPRIIDLTGEENTHSKTDSNSKTAFLSLLLKYFFRWQLVPYLHVKEYINILMLCTQTHRMMKVCSSIFLCCATADVYSQKILCLVPTGRTALRTWHGV